MSIAIGLNPTAGGRRLDGRITVAFMAASLADHGDYDWIYHCMDTAGEIWSVSVSMFSHAVWSFRRDGASYWAEQPYPLAEDVLPELGEPPP